MTRGLAQPVSLPRGGESGSDHQCIPGPPLQANNAQPIVLKAEALGNASGEPKARHAPEGPQNKVIAVVCSGNLPTFRDEIKAKIAQGVEQREGAVWVCLEAKSDRLTLGIMQSLGVDPVVLPLVPSWKGETYDVRRTWRDGELLTLCDEVVVFLARTSNSPWRDRTETHKNLYLLELGAKPKPKARKTRKPKGEE